MDMKQEKMTLQDYINKYGEDSGTKRYNGVQKLLASRKKTYESQPYVRFTKEWFIWKYPDDGLTRFDEHVSKSRQSEENMIKRWGEELGKQKWKETVEKKNTVAISRKLYGDEIIKERYNKLSQTMKNKSPEEKAEITKRRKICNEKYIAEKVRGKTRLAIVISKYGEIEGTQKYHEIMKKSFHGPNRMSASAKQIYVMLCENLPYEILETIYCDVPGKKEFWLRDTHKFYGYDFTHRESKSIIEVNGSFWHPTTPSPKIHPVTKKTLEEMFIYDLDKKSFAEKNGFTIYVITDKMSMDEQLSIVIQFCNRITNHCREIIDNSTSS